VPVNQTNLNVITISKITYQKDKRRRNAAKKSTLGKAAKQFSTIQTF